MITDTQRLAEESFVWNNLIMHVIYCQFIANKVTESFMHHYRDQTELRKNNALNTLLIRNSSYEHRTSLPTHATDRDHG